MDYLINTPVASFIFVFTIVTSVYAFSDHTLYGKFMLNPYSISRNRKFYTLVTSGLIHADWMHLIFNMLSFYFFAFRLEAMMGSWRFGILYFLGLILSDIPSVIKHKNNIWYNSLGASGAISAVLFGSILFDPLSKIYILPIPFPVWVWLYGAIYLAYCWQMAKNSRDNINHDAHFFGALAGLILTIILVPGIIPHFIGILTGNG